MGAGHEWLHLLECFSSTGKPSITEGKLLLNLRFSDTEPMLCSAEGAVLTEKGSISTVPSLSCSIVSGRETTCARPEALHYGTSLASSIRSHHVFPPHTLPVSLFACTVTYYLLNSIAGRFCVP
jgi:hypothetical protein